MTINKTKSSIHAIRGHLSTIAIFLELDENSNTTPEERDELLEAAKENLALVCSEIDGISESLAKLCQAGDDT